MAIFADLRIVFCRTTLDYSPFTTSCHGFGRTILAKIGFLLYADMDCSDRARGRYLWPAGSITGAAGIGCDLPEAQRGLTEIAELFRAGVDVYSHTVAGLGNHFDRWNARSNQDRIGIAKALLLAAPLQLGPAKARTIAESGFGVLANVTAAEIVGLYRAV